MTSLPSHSSVLIVGAGPSGLMMAAQLLRNGIHPVIIDAKRSLNNQSRAIVVQARSLEIFRQMEIDDLFLEQGNILQSLALHKGNEEVAFLNLASLGEGKSHFPHILTLEQSKTERILLNYLTSNACPLYWNSKLIDFTQTDQGVKVTIDRSGEPQTISCDWLIGADGISSKVRNTLGIPFTGGTYQNQFYLADISLGQNRAEETIRIFLKEEGFAGFFPMKGDSDRFIGVLPKTLKGRTDLSFEDLKPYLTYTIGIPLPHYTCNWFSTYRLQHRVAERFRDQRCFLIGDAAHVHSPVGGQGMNTGLQDAYNLAWKLSGVINGRYSKAILDTYAEERIPVAKRLLKTTDRLFSIAVGRNWMIKKMRNALAPFLLRLAWRNRNITDKIFALISQTGICYRESKLSVHHSQSKQIRAGDRLPYLKLHDEKLKKESDLHCWISKTGFTLLVLGVLNSRDLMLLAKWIKETYPFNLNFYYMPYSENNQHIFDAFEIGEKQKKAVIVRPDMHIGYMSDVVVIELIENYLKSAIGWNLK